ncbi:hypothetical protein BSKO_10124 [Bryopsis sp. KO-2023]|nr:hypothetical protein BSKO_10124 [Bryopsis sp. KO-2023]
MAADGQTFVHIISDLQKSLVDDAVDVAVVRRHVEGAMACPSTFSEEGVSIFYRCIVQFCGVRVLKSCTPKSCVMARLLDWYIAGLQGQPEKETTVRRILVDQIEFHPSALKVMEVVKSMKKKEAVRPKVSSQCDGAIEYLGDLFDVQGCDAVETDAICRLLKWVYDVGGEERRVWEGDLTKATGLIKLFLNPLRIVQVDPAQLNAVGRTKFSAERRFKVLWSDGKAESSHDGKVGPREGSEGLVLDLISNSEPSACADIFRKIASMIISTVHEEEPIRKFVVERVIQAFDRVLDRRSESALEAILLQLESCLDDASPGVKNLFVALLVSCLRSETQGWWWATFHRFFAKSATGMSVDDAVELILCVLELLGRSSVERKSRSGEWILERLYLMTCLFSGSDNAALCSRVDLEKIEGLFELEEVLGAKSIEMEDGSIIEWIHCMRIMAMHYSLHSSQPIVRSVLRLCMCHESSIDMLELLESCMSAKSVATWVESCNVADVEMLIAVFQHAEVQDSDKLVELFHTLLVTEKGRACCSKAITAGGSTTILESLIAYADLGEDPISVYSIVVTASICDDVRVQKDVGARLAAGWSECILRNDPDTLALKACVHLLANHDNVALNSREEGPSSGLGFFIENILKRAADAESTGLKSWFPTLAQVHSESESSSPLTSALKRKFPLILSLLDGAKNPDDKNAAVRLVGDLMELSQEDRDLLQVSYKSKSGGVHASGAKGAASQRDQDMGFFTSLTGHSVPEASNNVSSLDLKRISRILRRAQEPGHQTEVLHDLVEEDGGSTRGPENLKSDMVMTKTTQKNLDRLLEAASNGIPILLEGATGVGKTATVMEAARQCNQSLVRINMSSRVGPDDLLARTSLKVNGLGKQEICFELQPFADAFQKGLWVLLDELNLAEEKTLQCIEHALDTGRLIIRDNSSALEPVRVLERHEDFRLFGTENPSAGLFRAMREKLSESFLSRFSLMVFKQLPESEWVDIVIHRLSQGYLVDREKPQREEIGSLAKQMVEFHVKIVEGMREQSFAEKGAYATITIRELLMWCDLLCNHEGQNAMDLAWLVYGSRFRHKGGEVVRKELIEAGFYEPTLSWQSSRILDMFSRDRKSSDGWWILNEAAWGERMGHVFYPDGAHILKECEAVHREIELLVMSPDFILKHGLQMDFSDMWLWEWIKAGASQSLLLPALADQLGAMGASLYASKFRHEEARKRIIQIFEQAFVLAEEPAVNDDALSAAPLMLGERFLKALNLILLAVKSGNPVLVEGKSGCGKSALVKALAFIVGRDIEQIVLTPESEPSALLGQRLPCSSDSKQAEIQWVNGPLTRAYTNGCFLLVDNLGQAEAAVLERLNPTLEVPPMLCLSEKGDGGPFKCCLMGDGSLREGPAEGFSFLATFTPPGKNSSGCDMLSNELSPALANRFSIIHVDDPMDKSDELFREEIKGMAGILMDCPGEAAQERVAALCWNIHQKLLPERNQLASLTMRSYIQMIDSAYLLQKRMHGQGSLDKALKAAFDLTFGVQLKDQRLREKVEKVVDESLDMPDCAEEELRFLEELLPPSDLVLTESRKEHAAAILACVAANRPVLLEGPPAVGKTALVTGLRRGLPVQGAKVEILNNSDTTTVQDYFGTWLPVNGKFTFCKGILVKAMEEGSWFLADELNLAPLPVISALAPVLEGCTSIDIPGASMCVQVHPDFRFFATQNDHRTAGRNLLPINIRNRFLEVQIGDFPVGELREVIEKRFNGLPEGDAMTPEVATQLEDFYFALKERKVGFTMREIIKIVRRFTMFASKAEKPPFWSHVALSLLHPQHHGSNEWKKVVEAAESVPGWKNAVLPNDKEWPVSVDAVGSKVCFREGPLHLTLPDINLALSKHWRGGSVPPSAFLRKLVQLAFAISAREPVLLSGPTSFKTELIRTWAAICGRTDHTVTLHITGETEAHDLLGHVNPMSFAELLKLLPALGNEVYARYALLHQEDGSGKSRLEEHMSVLLTSSLPNVLSDFADQVGKGVSSSECTEEEPTRDFLGGIEFDSCSDIPSTHKSKTSLLHGLLGDGDDIDHSSQAGGSNGWGLTGFSDSSVNGTVFDDYGFGEPAPEGSGNKIEDEDAADLDDFDFCKMSAEDSGGTPGHDEDTFEDGGFDMPIGQGDKECGRSSGGDGNSFEDAGFDMPAVLY